MQTAAPATEAKSVFRSRAFVAGMLCVFAFLVMMFSGLGDGFNGWSPWSPRDAGAFFSVDRTGTETVLVDTYAHAALRFGMLTVAMAMFGVVGVFAARELSALIFGRSRRCFLALLFTMYIWHLLISVCYLVPSSFFNDYASAQGAADPFPTYVIVDDPKSLDSVVADLQAQLTGTAPALGGLTDATRAAVAAHDLPQSFSFGGLPVDDGRSLGSFLLIVTALFGIVLSIASDFVLLGSMRVSARQHAKTLVPMHLFLQFALFAASYALIVRGWPTLLYVCLIPIATDSYSFALGRRFGRHALIPHVSAKKTWGGAVYGTLAATVSMFVMIVLYAIPTFMHPAASEMSAAAFRPQAVDPHNMVTNLFVVSFYNTGSTFRVYWWVTAFFSVLVMSFLATAGDLSFSAVKRRYRIKDFGTALGSHGGVLDRIDSMVAVYVFYFVYLLLVYAVSGRSLLDMDAYALNLSAP